MQDFLPPPWCVAVEVCAWEGFHLGLRLEHKLLVFGGKRNPPDKTKKCTFLARLQVTQFSFRPVCPLQAVFFTPCGGGLVGLGGRDHGLVVFCQELLLVPDVLDLPLVIRLLSVTFDLVAAVEAELVLVLLAPRNSKKFRERVSATFCSLVHALSPFWVRPPRRPAPRPRP